MLKVYRYLPVLLLAVGVCVATSACADQLYGYGGYGSPAAQNGYRDGLEAGRKDARDRERFDPVRAKRYRDGDHDYDNRYGSRDVYKREYRAAFEQGYREGYGAVRR